MTEEMTAGKNAAAEDDASLKALFEALARGEPEAMQEVCRRYGERVASMAHRHLGRALHRHMDTYDVAQEALIQIFKDAPGLHFGTEVAFLRWVRCLVERKIKRAARLWRAACRRLEREAAFLDDGSKVDPSAESPSAICARGEEAARISAAVAALPRADREVVVSRLILKLPWPAVAKAIESTEAAAQMRLTRARRRLAAMLSRTRARRTRSSARE